MDRNSHCRPTEVGRISLLRPDAVEVAAISTLGGTRRQSAARFVQQDKDFVALTASHDGPLTLTAWATPKDKPHRVHVWRDIEALLD